MGRVPPRRYSVRQPELAAVDLKHRAIIYCQGSRLTKRLPHNSVAISLRSRKNIIFCHRAEVWGIDIQPQEDETARK